MATRGVALTVTFMAINSSTGAEVTGDAANITPRKVKDGTSSALTTGTVTEVDSTNFPGLYSVAVSSGEADCNLLQIGGKSATSNVKIIPTFIQMERLPDAAPGGNGGVPTADADNGVKVQVGTGTGQINSSGGKVPATLAAADASGNLPAAVNSIANDAITSSSLAASAVTEIQTGLSTLDAAGVRTAIGLASANLDTQLSTIAGYMDTEVAAILAAVDSEVAAIKAKTDLITGAPAVAGDAMTLTAAYDAAKTAASATNLATAQTDLTTLKTYTRDIPTVIENDGTISARFTAAALALAPSASGSLSTEERYMICLIAAALGVLSGSKTYTTSSQRTIEHAIPNIDLTDSGDILRSVTVKESDTLQEYTTTIV